jgi:hypothetical protein
MAAGTLRPTGGNTVLLFGPQALSFHEDSFHRLRSTILEAAEHRWILDTIEELPAYWNTITKEIPKLQCVPGAKLLDDLNRWFTTGEITPTSFPLPNTLLTPLVVITQLTEYHKYLELAHPNPGGRQGLHELSGQNAETIGFCTGILSALAVACSADNVQFRKYGAVAVRLAMLIGGVVDAQDDLSDEGISKSFATAWSSPEMGAEMTKILDGFPEVINSVPSLQGPMSRALT